MASGSSGSQADCSKSQDINAKMKIVSNIVKACITEGERKASLNRLSNLYVRTQSYTKVDFYIIYKVKNTMRKERPFLQRIAENNSNVKGAVPYEVFREIYVNSLLKDFSIPTLRTFRDAPSMQTSRAGYRTLSQIQMEIKDHYTWARLPCTKLSMLIEKPERVRRRSEYLSKIAKYRSVGRNIVYIDERMAVRELYGTHSLRSNFPYLIMAASKSGLMHVCFYEEVHCMKETLLSMSRKLKEPTVFVISEKMHHENNLCPLPKPSSTKKEMSSFLTQNDIPHDPNLPKAELYSIIERCKNSCKTEVYNLDRFLSGYGHVILRRPEDGLDALNFFSKIWEISKTKFQQGLLNRSDIVNAFRNFSHGNFTKIELDLIEAENRIFTEDVQIEETIDRIMLLAKDRKIPAYYKHNSQGVFDTDVDYKFENEIDF